MKKLLNALLCFVLLTFVSSQAAIIEITPANARMTTMIVGGGVPAPAAGGTDWTAVSECVGAWLFNDNVDDSSGEGNDLDTSWSGDETGWSYTTTRPTGFSTGKSIYFDGSTGYIGIADESESASFTFGSSTDGAISLWFRRDDTPAAFEVLMGKSEYDYVIGFVSGDYNDIYTRMRDAGNTDDVVYFDSNVGNTTYYHLVWSFDADGGSSQGQGTVWISTAGGTFGDVLNADTGPNEYIGVNDLSIDNGWPFRLSANYETPIPSAGFFDGHVYQPIMFDATLTTVGTNNGGLTAAQVAEALYDTGITGAD